jgi:hypothetical protein
MNTNYKKEFVPHKQALALKELGFDELCFGWYSNDGTFYEGKMTIHQGLLLAPLYQQAFRWFREKYNIHIRIEKYDETKWWSNWGSWTSEVYDSYEKAELECLKKLIEIVKLKQ